MVPLANDGSYYRDAILRNSRFIHDPKTNIDLIDSLDTSGTWHAHVVKIEAGKRTSVLTETSGNLHDALRLLHIKSAQAVHQYTTTNGFGLPPIVTSSSKRTLVRGGVASPRALSEVIAFCGSSSEDEEDASESDDSLDGRTNRRGRRQRRSRQPHGEAVSSKSSCRDNNADEDEDEDDDNNDDDDNDDEEEDDGDVVEIVNDRSPRRRNGPPGWVAPVPRPSQPPRGPLPGWDKFPAGRRPAPPGPLTRLPPPPGPVPAPRPMSMVPRNVVMPPRPVPALLNITWPGRGCKNLLVQTVPSGDALRQMALMEARLRPAGFVNPLTQGIPPPPFPSPDLLSLRAMIRRVTLDGDVYEVTGFGDDLSSLFRSFSGIPRFDIEVSGVMVPVPRPRANSLSSANSDDDVVDP